MDTTNKNKIRTLISNAQTKEAIDVLAAYGKEKGIDKIVDQAAHFSGRYMGLINDRDKGIVSDTDYGLRINRLNDSILNYREMPEYMGKKGKPLVFYLKKYALYIIGFFALLILINHLLFPDEQVIYFHGNKNKVDAVLGINDKAEIIYGGLSYPQPITNKRQVKFDEIPKKFKNKKIQIGLDSKKYEIVEGQNEHVFKGSPIYVRVKIRDNFLKLRGRVVDSSNDEGVPFVRINVEGVKKDTTDKDGYFNFLMDEKDFRDKYLFILEKEGYDKKEKKYFADDQFLTIPIVPIN